MIQRRFTQPSLSREFAVLSGIILCLLVLVSLLVSYFTYESHVERTREDLSNEAARIDYALSAEVEHAQYLVSSLAREIVRHDGHDLKSIASLLKSFDSYPQIYHVFLWSDERKQARISSAKGVLDEPIDISDRDYIMQAQIEPWKPHIGQPIEGRVSHRWVIPISVGVTDETGRFIGIVSISVDIHDLRKEMQHLIRRPGLQFAIYSLNLKTLTQSDETSPEFDIETLSAHLQNVDIAKDRAKLIQRPHLMDSNKSFEYYQVSERYPYVIVLAYNGTQSDAAMASKIWPKLIPIIAAAMVLIGMLWLLRVRIIRPVEAMTQRTAAIARGEPFGELPKGGPDEIVQLSMQLRRVDELIDERLRVEEELRNKMYILKQGREEAELGKRLKSEFLAYVSQELKNPIHGIVGFAQVMKDQLYGPIENKKYRQYAADIHKIASQLLQLTQDMLALTKLKMDYTELHEKPLDAHILLSKAEHFLTEKLHDEKIESRLLIQDFMPRLWGDEFCVQQLCVNCMMFVLKQWQEGLVLLCEARHITEDRESMQLAYLFSVAARETTRVNVSNLRLHQIALQTLPQAAVGAHWWSVPDIAQQADINLEIARMYARLHHAALHIEPTDDGKLIIVVLFPANRIFQPEE